MIYCKRIYCINIYHSLSRVVRDGGDTFSVPLSWKKSIPRRSLTKTKKKLNLPCKFYNKLTFQGIFFQSDFFKSVYDLKEPKYTVGDKRCCSETNETLNESKWNIHDENNSIWYLVYLDISQGTFNDFRNCFLYETWETLRIYRCGVLLSTKNYLTLTVYLIDKPLKVYSDPNINNT